MRSDLGIRAELHAHTDGMIALQIATNTISEARIVSVLLNLLTMASAPDSKAYKDHRVLPGVRSRLPSTAIAQGNLLGMGAGAPVISHKACHAPYRNHDYGHDRCPLDCERA
jgi:hypothetical protein